MRATHAKLEIHGDGSEFITDSVLKRFVRSSVRYTVHSDETVRHVDLTFEGDLADMHGEQIAIPFQQALALKDHLSFYLTRINCAPSLAGYKAAHTVDKFNGFTVDVDAQTGKILVTVHLQHKAKQ